MNWLFDFYIVVSSIATLLVIVMFALLLIYTKKFD